MIKDELCHFKWSGIGEKSKATLITVTNGLGMVDNKINGNVGPWALRSGE